jgi:hypothetical protein
MTTENLSTTRRQLVRFLVLGCTAAALSVTPAATAAPEDVYDGGTP